MVLLCSVVSFQTSANEKKRNFTETVEAHVMLGVDPRRGDQVCFASLKSTLKHTFYPVIFSHYCYSMEI